MLKSKLEVLAVLCSYGSSAVAALAEMLGVVGRSLHLHIGYGDVVFCGSVFSAGVIHLVAFTCLIGARQLKEGPILVAVNLSGFAFLHYVRIVLYIYFITSLPHKIAAAKIGMVLH